MKIFGYEINKQTAWNSGLTAAALIVLPSVVYSVVSGQCGAGDSSVTMSGSDSFSCQYLNGVFSPFCPAGFPSKFDLCLEGFRNGFALAQNGVAYFNPAAWNQTYGTCNEDFGPGATAACTNDLTNECWSGAWVGFSWARSAVLMAQHLAVEVTSSCKNAASHAAGAAAGLTFFAGLVGIAVNAKLNPQTEDSRRLISNSR